MAGITAYSTSLLAANYAMWDTDAASKASTTHMPTVNNKTKYAHIYS